jgi:hypothetical protein
MRRQAIKPSTVTLRKSGTTFGLIDLGPPDNVLMRAWDLQIGFTRCNHTTPNRFRTLLLRKRTSRSGPTRTLMAPRPIGTTFTRKKILTQ